jgi:hypothetical protein
MSGLGAELNELFVKVHDVLNKIEILLPNEKRIECLQGIPEPSLSALSRVLHMMGQTELEKTLHEIFTEDTGNDAIINGCGLPSRVSNHSARLQGNHLDSSVDARDENGLNIKDDTPGAFRRPLSISASLQNTLLTYEGDPEAFLEQIGQSTDPAADGLPYAFSNIYKLTQKAQDVQIYSDFVKLHRRLEMRNFYLLAVDLNYHTGTRWCRNACSELASKIENKFPHPDVKLHLDKYIRGGLQFNKWVKELGGPGHLLALPLSITEAQ